MAMSSKKPDDGSGGIRQRSEEEAAPVGPPNGSADVRRRWLAVIDRVAA
ncbi:hypothetical protein GA0070214_103429 [Micromonospora chaiyaphumensis]|uniref:Uncharacterized protein n=1 Tax=Micromonospora chaiyaphumensis TaxID=307119 RepID=A0A1C4WD20_9ACTN|nr:hypothetical protein GA0070214_103429 [Micromonospora chaiyaphumensis]